MQGPRVTLRLVTRADMPRMLAWRNKDRVRPAFINSSVLSADEHEKWCDAYAERDGDFVFIVEERDSGRPVGQVSLYGIDWTGGTAKFGRLLIGEDDALGQGFASEATRLVLSYARRLGLREIHLEVFKISLEAFKSSGRAIALYGKHGFTVCGEQGSVLLMKQRLRHTHSVIVGSCNRATLVGHAIASVLEQTVQDWELIVSDDGSNAQTLSAIRALTDRDPRCRLLTVEHLDDSLPRPDGHRRAVQRINDAIKVLAGEIVHYLADDDLFDVNRFEIFDELFSNPDVVVGYGRLDYVDAAGHPTGETRYFERVDDPMNVLDQNQVAHRRLVFDRIPAWFEVDHYASDGEFFRAMSRVWSFCGIDRVVGYNRRHGLNMQATKEQSTGRRE